MGKVRKTGIECDSGGRPDGGRIENLRPSCHDDDTLRLAMEAISDTLWDWNLETGQFYLSPQWRETAGIEMSETTTNLEFWEAQLHPDDKAAVFAALQRHLVGEIPQFQCEHRVRVKDQWKWILNRGKIVSRAADGAPLRMIGTATDIDDQRQTVERLQQAKDAAEAAKRLKTEFLANLSHEIRTPMTAILGFTELLMTGVMPHRDQCDFLAAIQRNGRALLELINDLLDLARIESGTVVLEKTDYRVRQLVEEVLTALSTRAEEKGILLEAEFEPPFPERIHTDPLRLRQILTSLIGNAIKFTRQGGVRVLVRGRKASIQFIVRDTGIGIPHERIQDIFEPFTQVDASATRRYGGTGLGLAISQRLAVMLGGDIQVVSAVGAGSEFTLTLKDDPSEKALAANSPEAASISGEDPMPLEHPPHSGLMPPHDSREAQPPCRRITE